MHKLRLVQFDRCLGRSVGGLVFGLLWQQRFVWTVHYDYEPGPTCRAIFFHWPVLVLRVAGSGQHPYDAERVGLLRKMLVEARKRKLSEGLKARREQGRR